MRWVIMIAVALVLGFGLFQLVDIYPDNYVKIYVDTYLIEMSFMGFLLLLFLSVCAIYLGLWLFGSVFRVGNVFSRWRKRKGYQKANETLGTGYLSLIKGDWRKAEKSLLAKTDNSGVPYINYLAAAQAAQEQSQYDRRDDYLAQAYKAAPKERFAIGLAKARLHHMAGQHEQAEATLDDLAAQGSKNAQYVAMQLQTYRATQNWSRVHDLLPLARKLDALPEAVIQEMDTQAHQALLLTSADRAATWKELPKTQKQEPSNIALYAKDLLNKNDVGAAEKLIRNAMKNQYDDALVELYGQLPADKPAKLRRVVEGWLMARPESAELNLAAGRLAAQEKNNDVAIGFLEKAIELGQLPGAYSLLGELLETANESGRALNLYRTGIARLTGLSSALISPQLGSALREHNNDGAEVNEVHEGELVDDKH